MPSNRILSKYRVRSRRQYPICTQAWSTDWNVAWLHYDCFTLKKQAAWKRLYAVSSMKTVSCCSAYRKIYTGRVCHKNYYCGNTELKTTYFTTGPLLLQNLPIAHSSKYFLQKTVNNWRTILKSVSCKLPSVYLQNNTSTERTKKNLTNRLCNGINYLNRVHVFYLSLYDFKRQ